MPSNDESTTAFGVSSMMKSTPVRCSSDADVASLTADDAALHVVGGQLDERDGRLGGRARSDPLQRVGDEVAGAPLRLGGRLLLHLPDASRELVADLLLGLGEDLLPRLAGRHRRDLLEESLLLVLEVLQVFLQLLEVDLAVGDSLLAPDQLGQLPVDVVLLREHALLDLEHLVAAAPQLALQLIANRDGLLARLDRSFTARRVGFVTRLLEQQCARAACGFETRARDQAQHGKRGEGADCKCDHDCHDNEHTRSLRGRGPYDARSPIGVRRRARRAPVLSSSVRLGVGALKLPAGARS